MGRLPSDFRNHASPFYSSIHTSLTVAQQVGAKYYIGRPCQHEHYLGKGAIRYTSNSNCVACSMKDSANKSYERYTRNDPTNLKVRIDHLRDKEPDYYDDLLDGDD